MELAPGAVIISGDADLLRARHYVLSAAKYPACDGSSLLPKDAKFTRAARAFFSELSETEKAIIRHFAHVDDDNIFIPPCGRIFDTLCVRFAIFSHILPECWIINDMSERKERQ